MGGGIGGREDTEEGEREEEEEEEEGEEEGGKEEEGGWMDSEGGFADVSWPCSGALFINRGRVLYDCGLFCNHAGKQQQGTNK